MINISHLYCFFLLLLINFSIHHIWLLTMFKDKIIIQVYHLFNIVLKPVFSTLKYQWSARTQNPSHVPSTTQQRHVAYKIYEGEKSFHTQTVWSPFCFSSLTSLKPFSPYETLLTPPNVCRNEAMIAWKSSGKVCPFHLFFLAIILPHSMHHVLLTCFYVGFILNVLKYKLWYHWL